MSITKEFNLTSKVYLHEGKAIKYISRPFIKILIGYNLQISKTPIKCLVDSGCDQNLFPAYWGEFIGINIKSGVETIYKGIGRNTICAYGHHLKIYVPDSKINFITRIDFSYEQQLPLLGRVGFFDHFKKVIFDEENSKFILNY
ncbi:MAG: hypothetical protein ABIO02_02555 [Patescibacteria group bacterium]